MSLSHVDKIPRDLPLLGSFSAFALCACGERFQFRWTAAMDDRTGQGSVLQFPFGTHASQQQASAAHVAAAYELFWKEQPLTKNRQEHGCIFAAANAAEQNEFAAGTFAGEVAGITLYRTSIAGLVAIDGDLGKTMEIFQRDDAICIEQPAVGGDNKGGRKSGRRRAEGLRVEPFASKIKAAQKAKYLSQGRALPAMQCESQWKCGLRIANQLGSFPAGMRRGK